MDTYDVFISSDWLSLFVSSTPTNMPFFSETAGSESNRSYWDESLLPPFVPEAAHRRESQLQTTAAAAAVYIDEV